MILLVSCNNNNRQAINNCEDCIALAKNGFFIDYPAVSYEVGRLKYSGDLSGGKRDLEALKEREERESVIRIVNSEDMYFLHRIKYCYLGLNLKQIDKLFHEKIERVRTEKNDELEMKYCFDYGDAQNEIFLWQNTTCVRFVFSRNRSTYIFTGNLLDKRALETCGETSKSVEERLKDKLESVKNQGS